MTEPRRVVTLPKDPGAEPVCLLDKEWAARRKDPSDAFLAQARSQETESSGALFRFEAAPGMWERMSVFIEEEGECCPFFAFEQWEEGGEVILRITRPEAQADG